MLEMSLANRFKNLYRGQLFIFCLRRRRRFFYLKISLLEMLIAVGNEHLKKECTNFLRNVQKGLKIVQNLDARLLCFLRQKCAYFAIFGTQLHIYCDFLLKSESKELQDPWWRISSLKDSATFGIHNTSQKKDGFLNPRWFECLEIPATMMLSWLVLNLYPLYFFSWWNPMYINVQLQKCTNSVQNLYISVK